MEVLEIKIFDQVHHEDRPPVPSVHEGSCEGAQQDLGQHSHDRCECQHGRRAGRHGKPPHEGELDQAATEEGECLADEDDGEPLHRSSLPCFLGLSAHDVVSAGIGAIERFFT